MHYITYLDIFDLSRTATVELMFKVTNLKTNYLIANVLWYYTIIINFPQISFSIKKMLPLGK